MGIGNVARKIFGNANDRQVKAYLARVKKINALENEIQALTDEGLREETESFKKQIAEGAKLDNLLERAFAVVREGATRALGQRHYDVQLVGGMVLNDGKIAEMRTGEGKTLVATLAVYLNALTGEGVHVVTVNDYLASRDAAWMGRLYEFLGLTIGTVQSGMDDADRIAAYQCDITYATNNELGFDYLRDNMKHSLKEMVQRNHAFAIVDEVDSILIDEARTPLIISGPLDDKSDLYNTIDKLIPSVEDEHFELDEKQRSATLTEEGNEYFETLLKDSGLMRGENLYDIENVTLVHHIGQALVAHKIFKKDKDYIIRNDQIVLIDEFTGRMMDGRRYSNGLHQAIEAKENVTIQPENQTFASVTYQNYFRLYEKLAGMTGTAMTEASEFMDIYDLDVVDIPTNVPVQRIDDDDEVYRSLAEKYDAVVDLINECTSRGQPVLVGTTSIEKSELLSDELKKRKIKHHVLNARFHEQEAQIVAQAGIPGAVTIATNMAGRGTDIQLGGNAEMRIENEIGDMAEGDARTKKEEAIRTEVETLKKEVLASGGLYVIGTERHESRRIDNQLRGRSGRQGDPGGSKFFLSLEDDLLRIFAADRVEKILNWAGLEEGEAISHPWVNKALETSQRKLEAHNFESRKNILKFDDVVNDQRKVIFEQRKELMADDNLTDVITEMREQTIEDMIDLRVPKQAYAEQWDIENLKKDIQNTLNLDLPVEEWAQEEGIADEEMLERLMAAADKQAAAKALQAKPENMREVEKLFLINTLDVLWREHLATLDNLRQVIGLRGIAQRDPLNEFKAESFQLFEGLLDELRSKVTAQLMHVQFVQEPIPQQQEAELTMNISSDDASLSDMGSKRVAVEERDPNDPSTWGKVGRNELCPCGSGKKYKQCHGRYA